MATGNTGKDGVNITPRHQLGLLHGALNRLDGRLNVNHDPFFEPFRFTGADPDNLNLIAITAHFADNTDHLRGADIESNDQTFL